MKGVTIIKSKKEYVMFSVVLMGLMLVSKSLPSAMAELDDCHRNSYDQKRQCQEGLEDPFGSGNKCQEFLFQCKMRCDTPREGYRPVRGIQMEFKVKPIIRDIQIFKKKEE